MMNGRSNLRVSRVRQQPWGVLAALTIAVLASTATAAFDGFIKMKDGYFVDAVTGKPWVPHGIAYQTWNRPLGVWQTKEQVDYDLDEMVKMGANSIRVDFVWQHIEEDGDNQWKWSNYDYLVEAAEARGIRIFALIGYQWPPNWFPDEWYTQHPPEYDASGIYHSERWPSDIINYEHPQARAQYMEWFRNVCGRYKDSKAIVGWIIGNESGYLGLWSGLLDGYDPESEASFRGWCERKYGTIAGANAAWGTSYTNFAAIKFIERYTEYGTDGAVWADMVQWREDSIGSFTAIGAVAAKSADTNHLISYSTVGMQWGEEDWRYHAEDRGKITQACAASNAPIDYFSVNNYPWSILGHESQNGHWGISYTKKVTTSASMPEGVPVLYSETGFTSSESMWPGMDEFRQGPLVRNALWESLEAGANGTHIFAWHDRPYITDREKGFGILYSDRNVKPAFWVSRDTFMLMEQAKIHDLLMGSKDPKPDIGFLWTAANDSQYNRYECEMQQFAGALERLGFEPNFVFLDDLASGSYTNVKVLCLPRNMRVDAVVPGTGKGVLQFLRENVLTKGIHILASADLPGMQNQNGRPLPGYTNELKLLFGIDASNTGGFEVAPRTGNFISSNMAPLVVTFTTNMGNITNGYVSTPHVWKYNDEVRVTDGQVLATFHSWRNKGFEEYNPNYVPGWYKWGDMTFQNWFPLEGTNMLQMWGDSGIFQDFQVAPFGEYTFSTHLRNNNDDPLRNGKQAYLAIEWYDASETLVGSVESAHLTTNTPGNAWVLYRITGVAPSNAVKGRRVIRITGPGDGALYVDHYQQAPALVVKNHGTAKAAIFLYSAGDVSPDGNDDGEMDVLPWKWRYDYIGAIVKTYFGVKPLIDVTGPNAYLCLAEYRTCTNGATMWQVKNYMYDRFATNPPGGPDLTFTISSPLFSNRTVRAFEQGRIIESPSDGTIQLTLVPDGQEILHVYPVVSNDVVCQLADAPSVVHPFGDKNYSMKVKFDTMGKTNLTLCIALVGGKYSNQVVQLISSNVTGSGEQTFYMWIPDFNQNNTNYASTPDGGEYQFVTWLQDSASNNISGTAVQDTQVKWGVAPTTKLPTTFTKGSTTNVSVEWEELYEQLYWQHCPMTRNDAFPTRIALYRSSKTEKQFPGHFQRANQVADWLNSLGYDQGNPLDISFDNFTVSKTLDTAGGRPATFADAVETGTNGWTAQGLWHIAADQSASPTHSWAYNNGTSYNTGARNTATLLSPWIDLTNAAAATLSFKSWYETEDTGTSWDQKKVLVTTDGTNWTPILQVSGPNKQWVNQSVDLNAYAGRRIRIQFLFDTVDAVYNQFRGWYIDDISVAANAAQVIDVFVDTMESTTNWTASGLWRLSTNRAAGGIRSWVYNNGTNYSTGARNSGGLASRWIDLTSVESASLSFKSWYKTEDTGTSWDRKTVQVSTDGSNWTQVLQLGGPASEWTSQSLDLSAYAGQSIRLRFFFDTIDALNNQYEGWYVDEVRITAIGGEGGNVFSDRAESGTNGWMTAGLWHQAADLFSSPTHSWAYNNGSNYQTGARNSGDLITPWIDLTPAASAKLSFKSWYETEDTGLSWDRKLVYVSTNGTTWVQLLQVSGAAKAWATLGCDLSAYAGQRIRLRFFFDTVDATYNQYRGWYIDDINVSMVGSDILFHESFDGSSLSTNWVRAAGAGNWDLGDGSIRAWRIGNDDNIYAVPGFTWTNYAVQANIRYNHQGPYFNDAELYVRYQDRNNFVKVLIQNFYAFWRLKFVVRAGTNNIQQGWVHSFTKANRPVENTWYNLGVEVEGTNYHVYFDGEHVGDFGLSPTNFPFTSGSAAIGSRAVQLGIWEPQKGYYFVDDDEYSYYAASGSTTVGSPVNLDWGYLQTFFGTLILPSVYVMNDVEASNVVTWINKGTYNIIATDGGSAMKDPQGNDKPGRLASIFGAAPALGSISGLQRVTTGTNDHYVNLDYTAGSQISATGTAHAWTTITNATTLATMTGSGNAPALICHLDGPDPYSPSKIFLFNFDVDTQGQLTNQFRQIAKRVFEWTRGQAYKVRLDLKYPNPSGDPNYDITVGSVIGWALNGTGLTNLVFTLPSGGIMTGDNLYWSIYVYPWDSGYPWGDHAGFYSSANDGFGVSIPGKGLQIIGSVDPAYAGRAWGLWLAYNTRGENMNLTWGLKDKGNLLTQDNFDDGNFNGWSKNPVSNYQWAVTADGKLSCTSAPRGGYSMLMKDGLSVADTNVTIEYDVLFTNGATGGGMVYRGYPLYVNPQGIWWSSENPIDFQSPSNFSGVITNANGSITYVITGSIMFYVGPPGLTSNEWHHIAVSIRDGDPAPVSDIYVDGVPQFMDVPLPGTNWTSTSVGFISPYTNGCVRWDNFRVSDELYSFESRTVNGEFVETNAAVPAYWATVPDYDPLMWEHEGTTLGGLYEWYAFFRGTNLQATQDAHIYFAPRLMTEDTNFPTSMRKGETVHVPVEWENMPTSPLMMKLSLEYPYESPYQHATTIVSRTTIITQRWGSAYLDVTVPGDTPAGDSYLWSVCLYPTNSTDPMNSRIGLDDTFRFSTNGPVTWYPREITVEVTAVTTAGTLSVYSDAGIPAGADILVWGADAWYTITSPTTYDGGFESHGLGTFPTGGYWQAATPGGGAGSVVNPESAYTGVHGLWSYTGSETWSYWRSAYQEFFASEGDNFRCSVYVRQPTGEWGTWVAGSRAFLRMNFLDASYQSLWMVDSAVKVTAEDQGWTLCQITNIPAAPRNTKYMRIELVVDKPAGASGVSVACFDDLTVKIGNSFYGDYEGEGVSTPEGVKCFRSTVLNWSGWGVFYTSNTLPQGVDLSAYSNGYLKFWLKTPGYTRVELQDIYGHQPGYPPLPQYYYGPTTDGQGNVVWQEKVIAITNFTGAGGVDLRHMRSPFMATDPIDTTVPFTFLIDNVRWTLNP